MRNGRPEFKRIAHRLQGLVLKVDRSVCVGCGECAKACIFGNISFTDGKPFFSEDCKGCGFCALACPNQAISIRIEDPAFIEEAISRISGAVDVT
jgi:UDP-glucose 4-epimerase